MATFSGFKKNENKVKSNKFQKKREIDVGFLSIYECPSIYPRPESEGRSRSDFRTRPKRTDRKEKKMAL